MSTKLVQVRLDDRIVAAMGDVRKSAYITAAIVAYANLNPGTYAHGAPSSTAAPKPTTHLPNPTPAPNPQPVDTRERVTQYQWDEMIAELWSDPDMDEAFVMMWMNERYVIT